MVVDVQISADGTFCFRMCQVGCMYVCMNVYMSVCVHVCMHVCVHAHVSNRTPWEEIPWEHTGLEGRVGSRAGREGRISGSKDSKHLAGREQPHGCSQARSQDKIQMLPGPWWYSLAGC